MNVSDDRVREIRETYFRGTYVVGRAELVAICDELLHRRSAPDAPEKPPGDTILVRLPREFANSMQTHRSTDALACATQQTLIDACRDALANPVAPVTDDEDGAGGAEQGDSIDDVRSMTAANNLLRERLAAAEKHRDSLAATLIEVQKEKLAVEKERDEARHALDDIKAIDGPLMAKDAQIDDLNERLTGALANSLNWKYQRDEARAALAEMRAAPTAEECDIAIQNFALACSSGSVSSRDEPRSVLRALMKRAAAAPPSDDRLRELRGWVVKMFDDLPGKYNNPLTHSFNAAKLDAAREVCCWVRDEIDRLLAAPDHVRDATKMVSAPQAPVVPADVLAWARWRVDDSDVQDHGTASEYGRAAGNFILSLARQPAPQAPAASLGDPRAVSASGDKGVEVCRTTFAAPAATPDEAVPELPPWAPLNINFDIDNLADRVEVLHNHVRALTARVAGRR